MTGCCTDEHLISSPPHICVETHRGIQSYILASHGLVDLAEPIPSQVKRRLIPSNLNPHLAHGHVTIDSVL